MAVKKRVVLGLVSLLMFCSVQMAGSGAPSPRILPRRRVPVPVPLGGLLLARSVYTGTPSTITVGQILPTGGAAVADGGFPEVFDNDAADGNFGITSPIFIDRSAIVGDTPIPVTTLPIPTSQMVTSYSSKSELSIHLSTDGRYCTFMGYIAAENTLDVSNANTPPPHFDPTNPVTTGTWLRAVGQVHARSLNPAVSVTGVNVYTGDNGRGAMLDSTGNAYFMVGNDNSGTTTAENIMDDTGVQMVTPGAGPLATPVGMPLGTLGASKGRDYGFSVALLGYPADKSGKDTNFRGMTIFDNTLYVTKGSGGNGINTVYQVGTAGTLPTFATAATTTLSILPGFPTLLAKSSTGVSYPFGIWFADADTLYVGDEGSGSAPADPTNNPTAGIQKWVRQAGTWHLAYILQNGLNLGVQYSVPGLDPSLNPAPDGIRSVTGRVNGDGTVTLWATTSTVSNLGDQGADSNQLVTITDTLSYTTAAQASGESFTLLQTAPFAQLFRGVEFVPLSEREYAEQLIVAAKSVVEGLPDSDFRSKEARRDLISDLKGAADAVRDDRLEDAERALEDILKDDQGITDSAAQEAVSKDVSDALGALPDPDHARRGRK